MPILGGPSWSKTCLTFLSPLIPETAPVFRFHCLPKAAYLRKLCLRSVAWGLMVIFLGMVAQRPVSAGCHYGDSQFAKAIAAQDPHGHVRNFRFLGQLVYEGGDIKYVPWQATPRCQGPNCHADQRNKN